MAADSLENRIRELLLREEIAPGERLTESALAERLGVSRTPIRNILPRLAAEGMIRPVGKRGYVAAEFSANEIFSALDLRALLEGWAAAEIARRGAPDELLGELAGCLNEGDLILSASQINEEVAQQYGEMNERFHGLIIASCKLPILTAFIAQLDHIPYVSPAVIVFDEIGHQQAYNLLNRAHGFHHAIFEAIRDGEPARAEFLFREHANQQRQSMFEQKRAGRPGPARSVSGSL